MPWHCSRHLFVLRQVQKQPPPPDLFLFMTFFVCFLCGLVVMFYGSFVLILLRVFRRFSISLPHPRQIRQYFKDDTFYVTDLEARGLCDDDMETTAFVCEEFGPSAATVKVNFSHPLSQLARGYMSQNMTPLTCLLL